MPLSATEKRQLRAKAHGKNPIVLTGAGGMSEAVLHEIDLALEHHELIKVRLQTTHRDQRKQMAQRASEQCNAELVQLIGHVAVLYRRSKQSNEGLARFTRT